MKEEMFIELNTDNGLRHGVIHSRCKTTENPARLTDKTAVQTGTNM